MKTVCIGLRAGFGMTVIGMVDGTVVAAVKMSDSL